MHVNNIDPINAIEYDHAISLLRSFFKAKGFIEVAVQHRLSILAACEDPRTISTFMYAGLKWPLPQTGQMWLEHELLNRPNVPGYFCVTTSYRNEPHPIAGRHNLIFPMFEFELPGGINELKKIEGELLDFLGFSVICPDTPYPSVAYAVASHMFSVIELNSEHEEYLNKLFGPAIFLENFPERTSPFWNMRRSNGYAHKIDVILAGQETIGSAERSTNPDEMRERFHTISNGMYAKILFDEFGKDRVEVELERFLSHAFIERSGGGIGMTRMIRALKLLGSENHHSATI